MWLQFKSLGQEIKKISSPAETAMEVNIGKLYLTKIGSGQDTRVNTLMLLKRCRGYKMMTYSQILGSFLTENKCFKICVSLFFSLTWTLTTLPFSSIRLALSEVCCTLSLKAHSGHRIEYLNWIQSKNMEFSYLI